MSMFVGRALDFPLFISSQSKLFKELLDLRDVSKTLNAWRWHYCQESSAGFEPRANQVRGICSTI